MFEDISGPGLAPGDAPVSRPTSKRRPIGAFMQRLARAQFALPIEGHLVPFDGATGWLNSDPLTPEGLLGRVVLVNFWTYTCVNWIRTLPYVRAWAAKYAKAGLVVVGVHTPEFGFEQDLDNVVEAARSFEVSYPIALDNDYAVWNAFENHFWPAVYLADVDGKIRHHHFGEGEYEAIEMAIQHLLLEAGANSFDQEPVIVDPQGLEVTADWANLQSAETYSGYLQGSGFAQARIARFDTPQVYDAAESLPLNSWELSGNWTVKSHFAVVNEPGGRIAFQFHARDLNLVMGRAPKGPTMEFQVYLDGQPANGANGADVSIDCSGIVVEQRTYQLIRQSGPITPHRFEIEFEEAGAEVYCFTFG